MLSHERSNDRRSQPVCSEEFEITKTWHEANEACPFTRHRFSRHGMLVNQLYTCKVCHFLRALSTQAHRIQYGIYLKQRQKTSRKRVQLQDFSLPTVATLSA